MHQNRILLEYKKGVAIVTLNRGHKKNALDDKMIDALEWAASQVDSNSSVRVVVLHAQGDAFCAGLDMQNFKNMLEDESSSDLRSLDLNKRTHGISNRFQNVCWQWRALSVPVIAALHGTVFGGGLHLALGADMRYAQSNTTLSVMEIKWGLVPDMGGSQILRHLIGDDVARELYYTGEVLDAQTAKDIGLITRVVEQPFEYAEQLAHAIAAKNPDAIKANKRILNQSRVISEQQGMLLESNEQQRILGSANQMEAIAAELMGRKAQFSD